MDGDSLSRRLRQTRSPLLDMLHLRPKPPLLRSKSGGNINSVHAVEDVRVRHVRSPSEGDRGILKALRSGRKGEQHKRTTTDSPARLGLMQRIFSLRRHHKSVPSHPVGGTSGDHQTHRSRLSQMEERAAWGNNNNATSREERAAWSTNNNATSPEVKVRHLRSMSLSPGVCSAPPLAMFGTSEDICSSTPPSPKEGDTIEEGAASSPAGRRQISREIEAEIKQLLKDKSKSSKCEQDCKSTDHLTASTVPRRPANNRTCVCHGSDNMTELDDAAGWMAPGTLRKHPERVNSNRSVCLPPLSRLESQTLALIEPPADGNSSSSGETLVLQTVQLTELIAWKQVGTENEKDDSGDRTPQDMSCDEARRSVEGSTDQCLDDCDSHNTDGNKDMPQTDAECIDRCRHKLDGVMHSHINLKSNLNEGIAMIGQEGSVMQVDSNARGVSPPYMVVRPRHITMPDAGAVLTPDSVMVDDDRTAIETACVYTQQLTMTSQDGRLKSYSSVINDGNKAVGVTVTSRQVTWVHAQCTDVDDNRFSFTSNDSGIQQDEAPSSSDTTKSELTWPADETSHVMMLGSSQDRLPHKREPLQSCLSVPMTTLPTSHRTSRGHPKDRATSDLGGRAVVQEALQRCQLSASTATLVESDNKGTLSALEHCRMKGRRMSTPHPIKLREYRSPPLRKRELYKMTHMLPRRSSAPELIDRRMQPRRPSSSGSAEESGDVAVTLRKSLSNGEKDLAVLEGSSSEQITPTLSSARQRNGDIIQGILARSSSQPTFADALWDHVTVDAEELAFAAGDVIKVVDNSGRDWWYGAIDDHEGWFPSTFVKICNSWDDAEDEFAQKVKEGHIDTSLPSLSKDQARTNVVLEIIQAERDYVKHLHDVLQGYVEKACRRPEMFCEDTLHTIFGNILQLHQFSSSFLQQLEVHIVSDTPHLSQLGECFLMHRQGFELYSEYCNNHPLACEQLCLLKQDKKYQQFFEACRLLQQMIEIPLEGFLLIPVQKICKYPLQLKELLRFTHPRHPDYYCLKRALLCMRRIAALINERKRKMESLQRLDEWQHSVNDWQGADLIETSSELIHSGELMKVNSSGWSQDRLFFLFDHQMIYCKKDMLWRDVLIYKGRLDMDNCEVCPISDGKDAMFNVHVRNAFKVFELTRRKWYLLQCDSATERQQWLDALQLERETVRIDADNGFNRPAVTSKVDVLHHRQEGCSPGGTPGKGAQRRSMEASPCGPDMPVNQPEHLSLPRFLATPTHPKKTGFHPFGRRKGKR